jgi:2-keto-3-deoxy-L-rhamnonate aldolase RhmA
VVPRVDSPAQLEVPGLDAALVGPNDLSIALGVPGQTDGPEVRGVIERVIRAGQRTGVAPGLHLRDPRTGPQWLRQGIRLLSCASETGLLMQAGSEIVSLLREQIAE